MEEEGAEEGMDEVEAEAEVEGGGGEEGEEGEEEVDGGEEGDYEEQLGEGELPAECQPAPPELRGKSSLPGAPRACVAAALVLQPSLPPTRC
eukprot:4052019-Prymnesium_polylepis.1